MILPRFDYCDFVWNNLSDSRYNQLANLLVQAARIVLKEWDSNRPHSELKNHATRMETVVFS